MKGVVLKTTAPLSISSWVSPTSWRTPLEPEREEGQTATGAPADSVKKTGVNPEIVNDNGSQFMAKDFKELNQPCPAQY